MDLDLIRYIIKIANDAGFRGMKIIDWIPPQTATEDYHGKFVYSVEYRGINA